MVQIGTGNALGAFEAGVVGGRTQGPSGIGQAIRGMLQQGQKLGLINAQIGGQAALVRGGADYKQGIKEDYNRQLVDTEIYSPHTGKQVGETINRPRSTTIKIPRPISAEEELLNRALRSRDTDTSDLDATLNEILQNFYQ